MAEEHPKANYKSRRITQACDYCHRRSKRCKPSEAPGDSRCQNCVDFRQSCTYDRPVKRRGVKSQHARSEHADGTVAPEIHVTTIRTVNQQSKGVHNGLFVPAAQSHPSVGSSPRGDTGRSWKAPNIASQAVIVDLVEIYFEVIYSIFPFFHRPTFLRKISRGEYTSDRSFFAATMAACALVSSRIRDGAVYSPRWDLTQLQEPGSVVFFSAAEQALPTDLVESVNDLNVMRAYALLAVTSIQNGKIKYLQQYLGHFYTLVDIGGLHDEANWPKGIGFVELEERRRLLWSMYTLEIYSSIVWSGIIRCREQQADVAYPTEVDDEMFDDDGIRPTVPPILPRKTSPGRASDYTPNEASWLSGWNFTTDLYRILEHACAKFRGRRTRQHQDSFLYDIFGDTDTSQASVLQSVNRMYANLPQRFKGVNPITLDPSEDRFGFQAANITATMQLLRMVLFAVGGATIEQKCQLASEVVNSFLTVPIAYLRAISTPLLHHFVGIGQILGSVFEAPLCENDYMRVRTVLLSMAQILADLDLSLPSSSSASERLRAQVTRIDEYMDSQRQQAQAIRQLRRQQRQQEEQQQLIPPNSNYSLTRHGSVTQPPLSTSAGIDMSILNPLPRFISHDGTDYSLNTATAAAAFAPSSSGSTQSLLESPIMDPSHPHQLPSELFDDWPFGFASSSMSASSSSQQVSMDFSGFFAAGHTPQIHAGTLDQQQQPPPPQPGPAMVLQQHQQQHQHQQQQAQIRAHHHHHHHLNHHQDFQVLGTV